MRNTKLWLRNTSHYPDVEVWALIRCACASVERSLRPGQDMPRIIVKLTNTKSAFSGLASWIEWHPSAGAISTNIKWYRILCRVGKPERFPVTARYPRFTDMPEYRCETYREGIVHIVAHEIEHCLGASARKDGEMKCELSAWDAVEYYRKHQQEVDGQITAALEKIAQRKAEITARHEADKNPQIVTARKLQATQVKLAQWQRKEKLAMTKKRYYLRTLNRLQRRLNEMTGQIELPKAAK